MWYKANWFSVSGIFKLFPPSELLSCGYVYSCKCDVCAVYCTIWKWLACYCVTHLLLMLLVDVWLQVVYSRSCQPLGNPTCEPLALWWCRPCLRQALCMAPWEASPQPVALAPRPWPHKVGCSEQEEGLVRTSFWFFFAMTGRGHALQAMGLLVCQNLICDSPVSTHVMASALLSSFAPKCTSWIWPNPTVLF